MKKQKLQLLAEARGDEQLIDAIDYDMEVRILPQHLMWPSFLVAKQNAAMHKHVLLRRIQPPVKNLEDEAIEAHGLNMLWLALLVLANPRMAMWWPRSCCKVSWVR